MNDVQALEDLAEHNASRVLDMIRGGDTDGLRAFIDGRTKQELAWMVLSLGNGYTMLEHRFGAQGEVVRQLQAQAVTLNAANKSLFKDRRTLTEKNAELRAIIDRRALAVPAKARARTK